MTDQAQGHIPFNRPYATGRELDAIREAMSRGHLSGDGVFSEACRIHLQEMLGCPLALIVHSCTAALEMSALLLDVGRGDEVIMPSYSFVTTASAFAMRGAIPVFVDIRPDTLNLDERLIEEAVTDRTRAIVAVHYAGVSCEMSRIVEVAASHLLAVVEDAAQGICATSHGQPLGTIGTLGAISFHETKNVTCGHGGALIVNDRALMERAQILCDKGTNRRSFLRGEVAKYTWVDLGSSFAISDLAASFLLPQLQQSEAITRKRRISWSIYHEGLARAEERGLLRRPIVPAGCEHNAHLYYIILPDEQSRDRVLRQLNDRDINAVFHYIPLHSSAAGRRYGRVHGDLTVTDDLSRRLIRLPLWNDMPQELIERVVDALEAALSRPAPARAPAWTSPRGR